MIKVFSYDQHESHTKGVEQSDNFYFPTLDLEPLIKENPHLVARAARIEVKDTDAALHQHPGATLGFVVSGAGILRGEEKEYPIKEGDTFYIPARTTHVLLAAKGTTMTQQIVYIGSPDELQEYIAVD